MTTDPALEQMIGRLIWVGIRGAEPGDRTLEPELDLCRAAHVGGVILFDVDVPERDRARAAGLDEASARLAAPRNIISPEQTRRLTDHLRDRLGERLIISVDQEGGAVSRLGPARGFPEVPSARGFAALPREPRRGAAAALARTVADAGIDLNLAPCVDVAINADGPGLGALGRSFGRDPEAVTALAAEQIDAMHARGLACTIKHFPGHGSAAGDTHMGLVDITETFIEAEELHPFRALLGGGRTTEPPDSVMMSHLLHRAFDSDRPASLSRAMIDGLLRTTLSYNGLVLTDSLDMRAVADRFPAGEAAVLALEAGADIVLEANNLAHVEACPALRIHHAVCAAVGSERLTRERIERSVERLDRFASTLSARRERLVSNAEAGR